MRLNRFISCVGVAAVLAVPVGGAAPSVAQEVERIVAVVNDEVISVFDLEQRLRLVMLFSGLDKTPAEARQIAPQVLRNLISERLRLQEARRNNISVSDAELESAIARIKRTGDRPAENFEDYLKARNIGIGTVKSQLRSDLAWRKLVRRRLLGTVTVGDDEVEEEFERIKASQGTPEYLASEIFLVVQNTGEDVAVRENAEKLVEQIGAGADFAALARQFSNGSTAAAGGDMGWVQEHQLAEDVAAALAALEPGQVSAPIRSNGGYLIAHLRDRRLRMLPSPDDVKVELKQILLPMPPSASDEEAASHLALAETIRSMVTGCDDMTRVAAEVDSSTSADLGTERVGDLRPDLRRMVLGLPIGSISMPERTRLGILLLMVCDRIAPATDLPDREMVRRRLMEARAELMSRRYLRDLRRIAYVDIRI